MTETEKRIVWYALPLTVIAVGWLIVTFTFLARFLKHGATPPASLEDPVNDAFTMGLLGIILGRSLNRFMERRES